MHSFNTVDPQVELDWRARQAASRNLLRSRFEQALRADASLLEQALLLEQEGLSLEKVMQRMGYDLSLV